MNFSLVITGPARKRRVPVIPTHVARRCLCYRDCRDKPGNDDVDRLISSAVDVSAARAIDQSVGPKNAGEQHVAMLPARICH
jgi:hypothetical protein